MTKICSICKQDKQDSSFYKTKDGLHPYCKSCNAKKVKEWRTDNRDKYNKYQRDLRSSKKDDEDFIKRSEKYNSRRRDYRNTSRGKAATMWSSMCSRVKNKYTGIENKLNRDDFIEWATNEIDKFWDKHPEETPSLDRINPDGHYEFGNIRIVSLSRNIIRSKMFIKKLEVDENSTENEVFEKLAMTVFSVCFNTKVSVTKFSQYLKDVSNDEYLWDESII